MRIISGKWKGIRLKAPMGRGTRPMLDRVREALFSVLGNTIDGGVVWDSFAGTGALGLEALSRGAEKGFFWEKSRQVFHILMGNVSSCLKEETGERAFFFRSDGWTAPEQEDIKRPDLIFLDPPYWQVQKRPERAGISVRAFFDRLKPGGVLVFHVPASLSGKELKLLEMNPEERVWGTSRVFLIRK